MADERDTELSTTEARAGATPHMTRYVLVFGLIGVVALFAVLLFAFA